MPYLVRPMTILLIMGAVIWSTGSADAVTASWALLAAVWFTGMLQLVLLNWHLRKEVPSGKRKFAWGLWLRTSLPIFLVESFYMLLTNTDVQVLSRYSTPDEVGVYYAAVKTLALMSFVPFAISAAAAHRFTEYDTNGEHERLASLVRDTVQWSFWPSLLAAVGLIAIGKPLLWVFGPEFTAGWPLMFILVIGLMARASVGPVDRVLNMLGHQNMCATVYAVAFGMNLALNFALIPRFGMLGAAWATTIALVVESALLYMAARERLGLHVFIFGRTGAVRPGPAE